MNLLTALTEDLAQILRKDSVQELPLRSYTEWLSQHPEYGQSLDAGSDLDALPDDYMEEPRVPDWAWFIAGMVVVVAAVFALLKWSRDSDG